MTEEEQIGYRIVMKALRAPIKQIAENSGIPGEQVIAQILLYSTDLKRREPESRKSNNYGYDFLNKKYGDLIELGVIDPTKVVKNALRNAAGVASMLLTTEVVVVDNPDDVVPVTRTPRGKSQ